MRARLALFFVVRLRWRLLAVAHLASSKNKRHFVQPDWRGSSFYKLSCTFFAGQFWAGCVNAALLLILHLSSFDGLDSLWVADSWFL
jgi:hypothetical protein